MLAFRLFLTCQTHVDWAQADAVWHLTSSATTVVLMALIPALCSLLDMGDGEVSITDFCNGTTKIQGWL